MTNRRSNLGQPIELEQPLVPVKKSSESFSQSAQMLNSQNLEDGLNAESQQPQVQDEAPFSELSYQQIGSKMKEIAYAGISVTIGILLNILLLTINLHYAGNLNDSYLLAGIGLGSVLINFSGGYFFLGLNQGAGALMGRAFGF